MKEKIIQNILTIVGTAILALSSSMFIIPYNILTGGVAGVSIILHPIIVFIDKDIIASIVSITLFIVGAIFLGKEFAVKTFLSTIIYSPLLIIFTRFLPYIDVEPLLASIYGGLLAGIGVGLVLKQGGSTGGMDVPPLLMNKYAGANLSHAIYIVDAFTVIFGLIEFNIGHVLLGLISVYFSNVGITKMLEVGGERAKELKIISDKYSDIIDEIHQKIERGTTLLEAQGGYTKNDKKVVMCIVEDSQTSKIIDIVNRHDNNAFVIVSDVKNVHGEGFSPSARI